MSTKTYKQKLISFFGNNAEIHDNCTKFFKLLIDDGINPDEYDEEYIEQYIGTFEPLDIYESNIICSLYEISI